MYRKDAVFFVQILDTDYEPSLSLSVSPAAFIRVVGSEFVQKYLGEGPRMVRDVFRLAKENAPAIIFIDEIDAIATKRFDAQTGGTHVFVSQMVLLYLSSACHTFYLFLGFPIKIHPNYAVINAETLW